MFKNPFSFKGRIRRKEYGISYLIFIAALITVTQIWGSGTFFLVPIYVYIPIAWFILAQGAKRCHDRGNSAVLQIVPFYLYWMLFADSEVGINEYGLNPKGIGNIDEAEEIGNHLNT